MSKHAKSPMLKRVRPMWALAALAVAVLTAGAYALWTTPPQDDEEAVSVDDNWHPPILPPKLHHVEAAPPEERPKPIPPKKPPSKPAVHRPPPAKKKPRVVALTRSVRLVAFLRAQVGDRYVWGGNGPNAWDCSGLTKAAYAHIGISLYRTSQMQSTEGTRVSLSRLRVGDLLFWGGYGTAHHVAIYIGHGEYIAAENPQSGVVVRSLSFSRPDFARRIL